MSSSTDKRDELRLLINSRHPIITIESSEESRVEEIISQVCSELGIPFIVWTVTKGLQRRGTEQAMYETEDPDKALANIQAMRGDAIFLLKDFVRYLEQDKILRRVRELAASFHDVRRAIVLSAPVVKVPPELEDEAVAFHLAVPDAVLLQKVVHDTLFDLGEQIKLKKELDPEGMLQLARNLIGLTKEEAKRTLTKCVLEQGGRVDARLLTAVLEAKRASVRQEGVLEFLKSGENFAEVAGLANLKQWLKKRRGAMTVEGRKFGLDPPKGVLITGVQGCGKSLCAKAVAGEWKLQLARLDAGSLYDKFVGESEKRLRKALELAEQLAPLVLWIDEMEKGFAATASSADVDAGLTQRILGTLLTWLQDRSGGVFMVATCNNISALPPELLRKGRFDEIFFVDLPDAAARAELFQIHLKRRGREAKDFDFEALATASAGFSGSEIEQVIVAGMYTAFSQEKPLSTEILAGECRATRPLSVTRAEDIARLREWAQERAVPAN